MALLLWSAENGIAEGSHRAAPVPYLTEPLLGDLQGALARLQGFAQQPDFHRILRRAGTAAMAAAYHEPMDDAALPPFIATCIAKGQLQLGRRLPPAIALRFDPDDAVALRKAAIVVVPDQGAGRELLSRCGRAEALREALAHPAAAAATSGRTVGADPLEQAAAWLANGALLLLPGTPDGRVLRLAWALQPSLQSAPVLVPAPPDPPRPRAVSTLPQRPPPPAAALPPPGPAASPQAAALRDAAGNGTPFCEACARALVDG
jgi:hypothetical protein